MNQSLFKPRALLLATAFAAAGVVGAQTTDSTPASTAATPAPAASTSYAPCANMEGAALSECLKNSTSWTTAAAGGKPTLDSSTSATAGGTSMDNSTAAITSRSTLDSSTSATAPSTAATAPEAATPKPKTAKTAGASNDPTRVASATPRNAQSKAAAKSNPVDNKFRAELRNCVQLTGDQRDSCLDRAIENRQQA